MKFLIVLTSVVAMASAQRPWYVGSGPVGYPGLANRFKSDSDKTATPNINNRFDGPTERIPIDARGDYDLVHRVNQWPRENRPFWVLNADHIEAHRNTPGGGQQFNGGSPQNLPSRFGGQSNNFYPDPYYYYAYGYDNFGNPIFHHY